jgi:hypothetical protein
MQSRRKILVIAVAVVIALMFVAAAVLVVRGFGAFYRAEAQLGDKKAEMEQLYQRQPFPSGKNLGMERSNLAALNDELTGMLEAMGKGQILSVNQSPPKFMAQFWETRKDLTSKAKEMGIGLANGEDFDFGFARHMPGNLPAPQDVPRLTQQLKIVQSLCEVLYAGRINDLRSIGREEFEVDAISGVKSDAPVGRHRVETASSSLNVVNAGAGTIPEGRLFGNWHFVVVFSAKNSALLTVLNGLASGPLFAVVTSLDVAGDAKLFVRSGESSPAERRTTAEGQPAAKDAAPVVSRDQRVVCGRDVPLTVRMEVDVYQFATLPPARGPKTEGAK